MNVSNNQTYKGSPGKIRGIEMWKMALAVLVVFSLSISSGTVLGESIYKWVDEKGTLNFSDSPQPDVRNHPDKKAIKENTNATMKKLEVGNRVIPQDMLKYGSAGNPPQPRRENDASETVSYKNKTSGRSPVRYKTSVRS
jgi:hypothetical protein